MRHIFRTVTHPEAHGRMPVKGDYAYTLKFPLENGDDLVVECGQEDLDRFAEMIGKMMVDDQILGT